MKLRQKLPTRLSGLNEQKEYRMKLKAALAIVALGVLGTATIPANASFFLTNTAGVFAVDEFDWASTGAAWTTGFSTVAGTNFTLNYVDFAVAVNNNGAGVIGTLQGLDTNPDGIDSGYEYTVAATLNETVDSCTTLGPTTTCTFTVNSGTFHVYYDTAADANKGAGLTTWTGFENGINIIDGTIASSIGGTFVVSGPSGTGGATLFGTTTGQNFAFVSPTLDGTTATTTLQIGLAAGNFVPPTSVDGTVLPGAPDVRFKGDANQQFLTAVVPEPDSLALLGLVFTVLPFVVRRRNSK